MGHISCSSEIILSHRVNVLFVECQKLRLFLLENCLAAVSKLSKSSLMIQELVDRNKITFGRGAVIVLRGMQMWIIDLRAQ